MTQNKILDDLLGEEEGLSEFERENYILNPLLTEINMIQDQGIQYLVRSLLLRAGPFWDIPSSTEKSHPPDELMQGGNVLHTRRVVRAVKIIADSHGYGSFETDMLMAAALLHDLTKATQETDEEDPRFDPLHPYTVDRFVSFIKGDDEVYASESQSSTLYVTPETLETILRLIRCHLGKYSPIPETIPLTNIEMSLHLADRIAAQLHYIVDGEEIKIERWISQ